MKANGVLVLASVMVIGLATAGCSSDPAAVRARAARGNGGGFGDSPLDNPAMSSCGPTAANCGGAGVRR